ncbi:ParB N-terminal domain-containing protein [Chamaesiphon sp. VAR_48_metabat_135_sub]|uniref:ParB N-terminal domain-containing protein n=1 Tax=Chamaesiphon sp. VAR_48_metabat_135_sub TaxID=2964699 RepID=UPI00286BF49E|nr:ParB N-terminal domain-containing protein [Chamaesiphon sp. VAR_48_metabat_135_sub]
MPRSNFVESELEQLADLMLKTDGLLRPLILRSIGVQKYTVVEGHREYYAAVIAKEKDLKNAEMVNAFVIDTNIHQSAIDQLHLLKEDRVLTPVLAIDPIIDCHTSSESLPASIEQLFPALVVAISQQLKPIIDQLAEQKKILDILKESINVSPIIERTVITPPIIDPVAIIPPIIDPVIITPPTIVPPISNNPLDLINKLNQEELDGKMERSGISKGTRKLFANIIAKRNTQLEQKFNDWDVLKKEVKGLGDAKIKEIISKLK